MNNNTELTRMEEALRNDEALRKKFDEAITRIAESGEAKNDGEIMVKAAAELGYSITIEDLERAKAAAEELSDEEIEKISGGWDKGTLDIDDKGHNNWCLTVWHCCTITLHTETTTHREACLLDYWCVKYT
ncbi:MAG: Nif11-like leader peptide family RiPP precursor [Oscillospiraceae bacterium]